MGAGMEAVWLWTIYGCLVLAALIPSAFVIMLIVEAWRKR